MDQKAISGVPWTLLTYATTKAVTVTTTIVLARLLAPADFGVMALAVLAVNLLALFNDAGLVGALIVRHDLYDRVKGTVLTLMVMLGASMAAAGAALSGPIADVFDEPRLGPVLAVLSATLVVVGHNWFYEAVLQRELEFRRRFFAQVSETATFTTVAIVAAVLGAGVWSLVIGQIARVSVYALALQLLAPYRVRPAFDFRAARPLLDQSRGFLAQGGFAFVAQNADYFAIGRMLGAAQVGFYSMAYRLAELPYLGIADPVAKVTFPSFSRMREKLAELRRAYLTTLALVALVACPLGTLLSATAEPFTRTVLGEEWLPMVGALVLLGIWAVVRPIEATIGWLNNSVGHASAQGVIAGVVLVPMIPGLLIAANLGGITAVAGLMLFDVTLSLVLRSALASRRGAVGAREQWAATRAVAAACVLAWLAARALVELTDAWPAPVALATAAVAGLAVYLLAVARLDPALMQRAAGQARRLLTRGRAVPA